MKRPILLLFPVFMLAAAIQANPQAAAGKKQPLKVKFDVLAGWKYTEGKTDIPREVRDLDGKRIEITGFMYPINETEKISQFLVLQSMGTCCFGAAPQVNHIIMVTMTPGKTVDYMTDPIRVIGTFSVGETREEGYLISIYQMQAEQVLGR